MKTRLFVVAVAASLFSVTALHAQSQTTTTTRVRRTHATLSTGRTFTPPPPRATTTVPLTPRTDGIVPRAIRSGNPLQMLNPAAPPEYGNGRDVTRHEPEDPNQRPQGLRLFVIEF